MAELKTEVENMGAPYEDICQEIHEGQFDGIKVTLCNRCNPDAAGKSQLSSFVP